VMAQAERSRRLGRRTVLFIDEIHRFNKAQQDAFLPYVERGDVILIGATTGEPVLRSDFRAPLPRPGLRLRALTVPEIVTLLKRALADSERGLGALGLEAEEELLEQIAIFSGGDARAAYNTLDSAAAASSGGRSPGRPSRTPFSAKCCSTTRPARSTTT